jgi:hypothetical protein
MDFQFFEIQFFEKTMGNHEKTMILLNSFHNEMGRF